MDANQSRRRTDLGTDLATDTSRKADNTLPYQGKPLDEDSIRLVEIQPAANESDPLVCTLREATLGSKPKFEALSYRWGDIGKEKNTICLNGFTFDVRKNLLDALLFLRGQVASGMAHQPFWIDALCINQSDMDERISQVRIMGGIYFMAKTVVVWLGSKYTDYQRRIAEAIELEGGEKGEEDSSESRDISAQNEMIRDLRTNPYWDRLWILQEIGRARILRVCFGNKPYSWIDFIHLMTGHHSDGESGPLRLDRLLRNEKYNQSRTLKRLLEEHREAKCLDPKDKVYGLVGLAFDAAGFPMDYGKSLYEVWTDTMVFMNGRRLFKDESQILLTGALVKSLLMADCSDPLSQISSEYKDRTDLTRLIDDPGSPDVFRLKAIRLGCIRCVGPSATDIIAKTSQNSKWNISLQKMFPADELPLAHWESDNLRDALLELDDTEVEKMCFNRPSTVVWKESAVHINSRQQTAHGHIEVARQVKNAITFDEPQTIKQTVQPRLYLAKTSGETSRKMGVASGLVQLNDLVCWVRSSRRALLVRLVEDGYPQAKMRVFGTALATEDMYGPAPDLEKRWESVGGHQWGGTFEVQLDAGTIFMLLS